MEPAAPTESLNSLLAQLSDITDPPRIPMIPQTWAWAILAAVLLLALAAALWAWFRHRRATAWRRAALAELRALAPALEAGDPTALATLQTLLRRVALITAPRTTVAPLTGDGWTRFLADTGGTFGPLARDLALAPYRPTPTYDGPAAHAAARAWIGHQHA